LTSFVVTEGSSQPPATAQAQAATYSVFAFTLSAHSRVVFNVPYALTAQAFEAGTSADANAQLTVSEPSGMQDAFVIEVAGANQYDGLGSFARSGYLSLTVVNDTANVLTGGLQLSTSANVYSTVAFAAPVPEPQGYALLVAGLGLVGAFARRRTVVAVQG
jgi:hypothetical protein